MQICLVVVELTLKSQRKVSHSQPLTMFSGLVEATANVKTIEQESGGILLSVDRPSIFDDLQLGDSIANNGCCLTIVAFDAHSMSFQAGEETLSKTNLGRLEKHGMLNLERSLSLGDRIGGHLVTGHVDGLGRLQTRKENADWCDMIFEAPTQLMRQMASKGSITIDGVSLTLVEVTDSTFSVALIPHTLENTTLGKLSIGDSVNLETDLLAKYVQRQLETQPKD